MRRTWQHPSLDSWVEPCTGHSHWRAILFYWGGCEELPAARRGAGDAAEAGFQAIAAEVTPRELRDQLTFPPAFGATEWGPIPFLPDPDLLVQRMEAAWGDLDRYGGISTTAAGAHWLSESKFILHMSNNV